MGNGAVAGANKFPLTNAFEVNSADYVNTVINKVAIVDKSNHLESAIPTNVFLDSNLLFNNRKSAFSTVKTSAFNRYLYDCTVSAGRPVGFEYNLDRHHVVLADTPQQNATGIDTDDYDVRTFGGTVFTTNTDAKYFTRTITTFTQQQQGTKPQYTYNC